MVRAGALLLGLFYVGYLEGILKNEISDMHRLVIGLGLVYAAYCGAGAIQNIIFKRR
jgi:hypothetical protein